MPGESVPVSGQNAPRDPEPTPQVNSQGQPDGQPNDRESDTLRCLRASVHAANALSARNSRIRNWEPETAGAGDVFLSSPNQAGEEPGVGALTVTVQCAVCALLGPTLTASKEQNPEARKHAVLEAQQTAASWVETHQQEATGHGTFALVLGFSDRLAPEEWQ